MATHDWMKGLGALTLDEEVVEVRFKNNRKAFFRNNPGISLAKDDRVVVEVEGGHDLGTVSLNGALAEKQFAQKGEGVKKSSLMRIYRRATQVDVEHWLEAKRREREVLLRSRSFAAELQLEMSISDVEFRGDGKKVTIYYTADKRVDFRELIRKYATAFRVKIEMRQIGARQSAAKVGGMGTCGRELCCSTWNNETKSVKTESARVQNLSLSASKLAGQCGKLKCCLNYELATYLEAWEQFPAELIELETDRGSLLPVQPDVLKGVVYYVLSGGNDQSRFEIPIEKVKKYIALNKEGRKVETGRIDPVKSLVKSPQSLYN